LQAEPSSRGRENSTVKDKTVMSITAGHEKQSGRKRGKHQSPDNLGLAVFSKEHQPCSSRPVVTVVASRLCSAGPHPDELRGTI